MLSVPLRRHLVTLQGRRAIFASGANIRSAAAVDLIMRTCEKRSPGQPEFVQAVEEVAEDLTDVFHRNKHYISLFSYMVEPERLIKFKVPWIDDQGVLRMNRGFRVQFNSVLGPYKGGLRFHPSVSEGVIKFLGFEQILKNSLTTLPMGGGKGGSDFDPKGKSEAEVCRFCQSFMTELHKFVGANVDVPAGDIGVGGREIGYLFGQYKRLTSRFEGVLTGKGFNYGGSLIRPEATGYGCVFYAQEALRELLGEDFEGKRCIISGSGNVAQYTAEKLLQLGAKPVTFSDSNGFIYEPEGFNSEQVQAVMAIKNEARGRCEEYLEHSSTATYHVGQRPWGVKADFAFPSATQNELHGHHAAGLAFNGCRGVFEGANMPSTKHAINCFNNSDVVFGPGKAANAGGVAVSGLEMSQNASMTVWDRDTVETRLSGIMQSIFKTSSEIAADYGKRGDLKFGANAAGFVKVADTMLEHGM